MSKEFPTGDSQRPSQSSCCGSSNSPSTCGGQIISHLMRHFQILTFLLFLTIPPLSATPENPLLPVTWFQEIGATDGSTQQCIIFTTIPGVEYTYEFSRDLVEWAEIGKTYGLGQQFAAAMRETAPAPPPPDPENPPATPPALTSASITIQPSSGAAGGTVVSWASLDHGNAVSALIPGNMSADWQTVPLFTDAHGAHQFFIIHSTATAPPEGGAQLETKDAAMIADLEAGWADFNTAVAEAAETARNTPPPPPPSPDARGFWRIRVDWSLDSDNDGSLDHLEFALAAQAPGADGLAGSAFNADTNGDSVPDGAQLDSDNDGIPDAQDIAPEDSGIAYANVSPPRYAMFTFADTPDGSFAINDRGTVLFPGKVWKAGVFQNLITDQGQIPGYPLYTDGDPYIHARAINDHDVIVGSGLGFPGHFEPGLEAHFNPILHWPSPGAVPQVVSTTAGSATTYAKLWHERDVTHLDNAGSFFSSSMIVTQNPDTENGGRRKWTLPAGANPLSSVAAEEHSLATAPGGIVWGNEYDVLTGWWAGSRITTPFELEIPIQPRDVLVQGGNGNLVATRSNSFASTHIAEDGVWEVSPLLANAVDLADNGTAIGTPGAGDTAPSILLNGKWTPLDRAVPGLPERWKTSPATQLSDTSPGGWILAHDRPGGTPADDLSAALLPIRVDGVDPDLVAPPMPPAPGAPAFDPPAFLAGGVDHTSTSAINGSGRVNEIWIMAPNGGAANTVRFRSPLSDKSKLTLAPPASNISPSLGFSPDIIDSNDMQVQVDGKKTDTADIIPQLKLGGTLLSLNSPIKIKAMKKRTVKVALHKVFGLDAQNAVTVPQHFPEEAALENYLNEVFGRQVNTFFDVTIYEERGAAQTGIDFDFEGNTSDLKLKIRPYDDPELLEATPNAKSVGDNPTANIDVWIIGGGVQLMDGNDSVYGQHFGEPGVGKVIVDGNLLGVISTPAHYTKFMHHVIAHEIGHVMTEGGHPDTGQGKAALSWRFQYSGHYISDPRDKERLMCSGNKANFYSPGKQLIKKEWDMIEAWLDKQEDDGKL